MKKSVRALTIVAALFAGTQAHAGIPVIDAANLANSIQQVVAWGQQYTQMTQQITQLQQQITQAQQAFNNLNGIRGMANLVNNPALRTYLPPNWNQTMNLLSDPGPYTGLSGSISAIRAAAEIVPIGDTGLDSELAGRQGVRRFPDAGSDGSSSRRRGLQAGERSHHVDPAPAGQGQ